jgi:hypothetical protein
MLSAAKHLSGNTEAERPFATAGYAPLCEQGDRVTPFDSSTAYAAGLGATPAKAGLPDQERRTGERQHHIRRLPHKHVWRWRCALRPCDFAQGRQTQGDLSAGPAGLCSGASNNHRAARAGKDAGVPGAAFPVQIAPFRGRCFVAGWVYPPAHDSGARCGPRPGKMLRAGW